MVSVVPDILPTHFCRCAEEVTPPGGSTRRVVDAAWLGYRRKLFARDAILNTFGPTRPEDIAARPFRWSQVPSRWEVA